MQMCKNITFYRYFCNLYYTIVSNTEISPKMGYQ